VSIRGRLVRHVSEDKPDHEHGGTTMPRFLSLIRVDESTVGNGPDEKILAEMGKLLEEMTKAGVLLDTAGLTPTADGTRVTITGGRISSMDGPFSEAKEVIGGYAMLQAKDKAEALEWTRRFLEVHGDEWTITCEVRQLADQ
jgi:hypothetical protein